MPEADGKLPGPYIGAGVFGANDVGAICDAGLAEGMYRSDKVGSGPAGWPLVGRAYCGEFASGGTAYGGKGESESIEGACANKPLERAQKQIVNDAAAANSAKPLAPRVRRSATIGYASLRRLASTEITTDECANRIHPTQTESEPPCSV